MLAALDLHTIECVAALFFPPYHLNSFYFFVIT
jgi:hypothetical protein